MKWDVIPQLVMRTLLIIRYIAKPLVPNERETVKVLLREWGKDLYISYEVLEFRLI